MATLNQCALRTFVIVIILEFVDISHMLSARKKSRLLTNKRPVSIYLYYNSALNNRSQHEALGSNYRICGVYFPDSYAEVYCFRLNLIYQNRAINTFNQRFHKCKKKPHLALVYLI